MNRRDMGLVIAGVLLGILPGYLIATSMNLRGADNQVSSISEPAAGEPGLEESSIERSHAPITEGECAVMVSQALTDKGAAIMEAYCFTTFPNFLSDK